MDDHGQFMVSEIVLRTMSGVDVEKSHHQSGPGDSKARGTARQRLRERGHALPPATHRHTDNLQNRLGEVGFDLEIGDSRFPNRSCGLVLFG